MERINLNVPEQTRAKLRTLAASRGVTEGELARTLMIDAVQKAEADAFYAAVAAAQTPELHAFYLNMLEAFDRADRERG